MFVRLVWADPSHLISWALSWNCHRRRVLLIEFFSSHAHKKKSKEEKRWRRRGQRCQRDCLIGVCECVCRYSTCNSEKRGQIEQSSGLLVGRGAVGDALLDERQAVRSQTHWEGGEKGGRGGEGCQTWSANYCIQSGEVAADDTNDVVWMMDAAAALMSAKQ